jgi:hypothetical protein
MQAFRQPCLPTAMDLVARDAGTGGGVEVRCGRNANSIVAAGPNAPGTRPNRRYFTVTFSTSDRKMPE